MPTFILLGEVTLLLILIITNTKAADRGSFNSSRGRSSRRGGSHDAFSNPYPQYGTEEIEAPSRSVMHGTEEFVAPSRSVMHGTEEIVAPSRSVMRGTEEIEAPSRSVMHGTEEIEAPSRSVMHGTEEIEAPSRSVMHGKEEIVAPSRSVMTSNIGSTGIIVGGGSQGGSNVISFGNAK